MYIRIDISETGAARPQDQHNIFNTDTLYAADMTEARTKLAERYGRLPGMRRKVYQDYRQDGDPEGTYPRTRVCGFLHSFWNADLSHSPVNRWHQTDWVSFAEVTETAPAELQEA